MLHRDGEGSGGRDIALHRGKVESVMPYKLNRGINRSKSIFESARPKHQLPTRINRDEEAGARQGRPS
jgi:hypothetical protein